MDNLTSNQTCNKEHVVIKVIFQTFVFFLSFSITAYVIVKILRKIYKRNNNQRGVSSISTSEVFLLQVNLIHLSECVSVLLYVLNTLGLCQLDYYILLVFHQPMVTAEPLFLLSICINIYLAVVHPVTYMSAKTSRQWERIYTALAWLYTAIMMAVCFYYKLNIFHPIFTVSLFTTLPPIVFLNISTLRALTRTSPEAGNQGLHSSKKKAFLIILNILLVMVLYYLPQVLYFTYRFIEPTDLETFLCFDSQLVFILPTLCEIIMPGLFLYTMGRFGVQNTTD